MNTIETEYMDFLKREYCILLEIHKNTADQLDALEKEDYDLLGEFINIRQYLIEQFEQLICSSSVYEFLEKNTQADIMEQSIRLMLAETVKMSDQVVSAAKLRAEDLADTIKKHT